jgi:hypothetical protein
LLVPLKLSLGSPPYTNSLCSTFQISCPYSMAYVVCPLNLSRSEAIYEGLLAPHPTPNLEDHPL